MLLHFLVRWIMLSRNIFGEQLFEAPAIYHNQFHLLYTKLKCTKVWISYLETNFSKVQRLWPEIH